MGLIVVFGLLQFIPRSTNKMDQRLPTDILNLYPVPAEVQSVLKNACYDCHSNNTHYPWYAYVQPVRLFLDKHVRDGKEELNFSEYGGYSTKKQFNKFRSIAEAVENQTMPLKSYRFMHAAAKLTETERGMILKWVEDTRHAMSATKE